MTPGTAFKHALMETVDVFISLLAQGGGDAFVIHLGYDTDLNVMISAPTQSAHTKLQVATLKDPNHRLNTTWAAVLRETPFLQNPKYGFDVHHDHNKTTHVTLSYESTTLTRFDIADQNHDVAWMLDALGALGSSSKRARIGSVTLAANSAEDALLAHYILKHPKKALMRHTKDLPQVSIIPDQDRLCARQKEISKRVSDGPLFS